MNARYVAWLVAGVTALTSFARGDTPPPTPTAAPAATPTTQAPSEAAPPALIESEISPSPATSATATAPTAPAPTAPAAMMADQSTAGMAPAEVSAPAAPTLSLPDPIPGDSVATVLAALGKPNGVITLPDKYLMMFDRGNVIVSLQDVVLETHLMPKAEYTAKLEEQVAEENDQRNAQARANALLDLLLNDPTYVAMSTRDRLLALAKFDREHPGSDAHQDYLDLLAVYAAEEATSAKVADLQNQAAEARAQAIYAQQQAANVAQQLQQAQQQTAAAQQQAATAQRQAVAAQQSEIINSAPTLRTGNGIVITGGGVPTQRPPTIISNHSITNVPPQGVQIVMPDGSIKYIPGDSSGSGNHTAYF